MSLKKDYLTLQVMQRLKNKAAKSFSIIWTGPIHVTKEIFTEQDQQGHHCIQIKQCLAFI
jgi:hypothetical protein